MNDFPEFMKHPANKIDSESQYTQGIEGYVFDGADGSQLAFWTNQAGGKSIEHTHGYDEYVVVVQGQYTVIIGEMEFPLTAGKEFFIPKETRHRGNSSPGTRTIHAFGGKRVDRIKK
jgi:quercetin dioxygenase-like cupin family protein